MLKPQCAKLRPYGKNWFRRTKHNLIVCKLMFNKHKNICVGVYWNDDGIPG